MKNNDIHAYDDIRNLPHPSSKKHPQMEMLDRAAQFAPFAALTGHMEAVSETQRLTDDKRILDEYQKELINAKLQEVQLLIKQKPTLRITYFEEDKRKCGGTYLTTCKSLKKIDEYLQRLVFCDGTIILIDDVYNFEMIPEAERKL